MSKPIRAAILVRISDDRAGDSAGVGRQEKDARALADRLGWQVSEVIVENDVSAFKRRTITLPDGSTALRVVRPGFRRLLELLALGQVDGLIAYDLDRVARDPRDLEDLIDVVEQTRVPVESVSGSLRLANDSDVTMARVMVAVANKSSRDSSRRISRKLEQLAQDGKYAGGGARCFGFEADCTTHNPAEADAIRWAADRIIGGASVSQTARDLDARGVATVRAAKVIGLEAERERLEAQTDADNPDRAKRLRVVREALSKLGEDARNAKWSSKSLVDILRGPRVAGLRVHRGEVVGEAEWGPILDRDTYDAVCVALHARAKGAAARPILKRWLNGALFCGRCGEALVGQYVSSERYRYWCSTTYDGCGGIGISGPGVEGEVERQVLDYLTRADVLASLAAATSSQGTERARDDLADDEAQLKVLARMWAQKQITLAEYAEARDIIEKRLEDARKVLSTSVPERVRAVLASDDIPASWAGLTPAGKREVVLALVKGWRVHPADLTKARRFDPSRLEVVERMQAHGA